MKNNWPDNIELSRPELKHLVAADFENMNGFAREHLNDPKNKCLILVVKYHLYIESLLGSIIELTFPKPQKLTDQNSKFSSKLDIVESLNYLPSNVLGDIRKLNKIRNKFSHKLDMSEVRQELFNYCGIERIDLLDDKLHEKLSWIVGFLHGFITNLNLFPFEVHQISFDNIYKRDKAYKKDRIISTYPFKEVNSIIEEMKIDEN